MLYPDFSELVAFKDRKSKGGLPKGKFSVAPVSGNHHSPFRGTGLEFDTVREYVPGDDIRAIDWRVTARSGSPHIKLFRESKERQVILCLDMNESMRFGTRNTFKSVQAAFIAAYLGWKSLAAQDTVSACLFGDVEGGIHYFAPSKIGKTFRRMLKMLSQPPVEKHTIEIASAMRHIAQAAPTGSLIYVISDFLEIEEAARFKKEALIPKLTKSCDVIFIAVNDIADEIIPPIGLLSCTREGGEKLLIDTDSLSGREAYAEIWKKNRAALRTVTTESKIPLIEMTTQSDVRKELPLSLKMVAKRR